MSHLAYVFAPQARYFFVMAPLFLDHLTFQVCGELAVTHREDPELMFPRLQLRCKPRLLDRHPQSRQARTLALARGQRVAGCRGLRGPATRRTCPRPPPASARRKGARTRGGWPGAYPWGSAPAPREPPFPRLSCCSAMGAAAVAAV